MLYKAVVQNRRCGTCAIARTRRGAGDEMAAIAVRAVPQELRLWQEKTVTFVTRGQWQRAQARMREGNTFTRRCCPAGASLRHAVHVTARVAGRCCCRQRRHAAEGVRALVQRNGRRACSGAPRRAAAAVRDKREKVRYAARMYAATTRHSAGMRCVGRNAAYATALSYGPRVAAYARVLPRVAPRHPSSTLPRVCHAVHARVPRQLLPRALCQATSVARGGRQKMRRHNSSAACAGCSHAVSVTQYRGSASARAWWWYAHRSVCCRRRGVVSVVQQRARYDALGRPHTHTHWHWISLNGIYHLLLPFSDWLRCLISFLYISYYWYFHFHCIIRHAIISLLYFHLLLLLISLFIFIDYWFLIDISFID